VMAGPCSGKGEGFYQGVSKPKGIKTKGWGRSATSRVLLKRRCPPACLLDRTLAAAVALKGPLRLWPLTRSPYFDPPDLNGVTKYD
jgi:hypothetical protein